MPPFVRAPRRAGRAGGLAGRRWLVLACESKLVLHDLASAESRDVSRSAVLESKAPTCLAFLFMNMPQVGGRAGRVGFADERAGGWMGEWVQRPGEEPGLPEPSGGLGRACTGGRAGPAAWGATSECHMTGAVSGRAGACAEA